MSKIVRPTPIEQELLREISEFCKNTGMSERVFGLNVVNNNKMVSRLREGRGVWSGTINSIRNYIATYRLPTQN